MGDSSFYHATVALSFQIEIYNLDLGQKCSFLATSLYIYEKVIFTKNWFTRFYYPTDIMQAVEYCGYLALFNSCFPQVRP